MRRKNQIKAVISLTLILLVLFLLISGIALRNMSGQETLSSTGLSRGNLKDYHYCASLIMVILAGVHLFLNKTLLKNEFKCFKSKGVIQKNSDLQA